MQIHCFFFAIRMKTKTIIRIVFQLKKQILTFWTEIPIPSKYLQYFIENGSNKCSFNYGIYMLSSIDHFMYEKIILNEKILRFYCIRDKSLKQTYIHSI